jgi:hypothetical protein
MQSWIATSLLKICNYMGDLLGPISTSNFQSNQVYQSDSFEVHGHNVHLRIGVFGDENSGYDVNYRYYEGNQGGQLFSVHTNDTQTASRLFWERLGTLPSGSSVYELYTAPTLKETNQGDRNITTKPAQEKSVADNVVEGVKGKPLDNPEPLNTERTKSESPKKEDAIDEYTGGTLLEDIEHWIPSLFQPAEQGIASLKNDLTEYTQDGGSPILAALGASGLDLLDTAMAMTQGIPLGILDLRNLGEGTEEAIIALEEGGSTTDVLRGLKKDASRALTIAGYIIPEGAVIKAANRALAGADIIDSLSKGDYKSASTQLAMAAMHEKVKSKLKDKKTNSNKNSSGSDNMESGTTDRWSGRALGGNRKLEKLKDEILDAHAGNKIVPISRDIKLKLEELGNLSSHLGVELAVVSKRTKFGRERFIIVGEVSSVKVGEFLRSGNTNRAILHTHPGLNLNPSAADISILQSRAQLYVEQSNFGVRAGQTSSVILDEFGNSQKFRAQFVDVDPNL